MIELMLKVLQDAGVVAKGFEVASIEIKGKYADLSCMSAIYLNNPNFK